MQTAYLNERPKKQHREIITVITGTDEVGYLYHYTHTICYKGCPVCMCVGVIDADVKITCAKSDGTAHPALIGPCKSDKCTP